MKKAFAFLLALVMVLSLCACGGNTPAQEDTKKEEGQKEDTKKEDSGSSELAGEYDIVVWCADNIVDLTKKQIDDFNKSNTDGITFKATVENVGEGDAATQMITDVEAGGDIYCFAQDQFARLVQANALAKLGSKAAETVKSQNDEGAVSACTIAGDIYAYPLTADNTYFMYYDKSVVPEDAVGSMEKIIEACEKANKFLAFDIGNAWYMASYFFGAGCKSSWSTDKDGHWNVDDDFNSDKGLVAMKGLNAIQSSPMFLSKSGAAELDAGAAVVVSGTWDSGTAADILKDNLGVAPLPKYTVDGKEYDLVSFMGYKLMGVKPQTDNKKAAALHKLAQYLTGEQCQVERHASVGWGPANLNAQKADAVQNDPVLSAVVKQAAKSVVQGQVNDGWWNLAAALAATAKESSDEAAYKEALKTYDEGLEHLKNLKEGLIFVGAWNGWNNADEADTYLFTGDGDELSLTIEVPESDYMGGRIVDIGTWDTDKGFAQVKTGADLLNADAAGDDNNIVFAAAGTYTVTINTATKEITITK